MIICRKCQRHHPDSAKTGSCACGADLRRDGIALVQSTEVLSPEPDQDELPSLDADSADVGPAAGGSAVPGDDTAPGAAAILKGRRRTHSVTPGRPGAGETSRRAQTMRRAAAGTPDRADLDPAGELPSPGAIDGARDTTDASEPRPAGTPTAHDAEDAPRSSPSGADPTAPPAPELSRRARSVNPRELVASQDRNTPNVGSPPVDDAEASTADATPATESEPTPRLPGPGERPCPTCAEPNTETRRFCVACGARLPTPQPPGLGHDTGEARRKGRAPRTWRQRARAAGGRLRYSSGFSGQAKARAMLAVFAAVAVLGALVGPGRERVLAALGQGSSGVLPASAELITDQQEPGQEVAGFGAGNVHDDDRLTGVGIVWEPSVEVEPNRIRLTLEEPTDVDKLRIAPGLADGAEDAPLVLKPSRIRLCADTGACQELAVEDSASLHTYGVSLGDEVRTIDLTVLAVHETAITTYPLAVISEVRIVP